MTFDPYSAPQSVPVSSDGAAAVAYPIDYTSLIGWPIVYALNIIVPVAAGVSVCKPNAYNGMWLGMIAVLVLGFGVAYRMRKKFRMLLVGAIVFALTQFFPIIHIFIALVAYSILQQPNAFDNAPQISSSWVSFGVTIALGLSTLCLSAVLGLLVSIFLPKNWFTSEPKPLIAA